MRAEAVRGASLLRGTQCREVARRLGTPGLSPVPCLAPGGGPGLLVDLVLHLRDLAVLHHEDVLEGRVEVLSALRLAREAAGDDDRVSLVVVVVRLGTELVELLRDGAEHVIADALRSVKGSGRRVAAARLGPVDLRVEPLQHSAGVATVEGVVSAANCVHVLFRHGSPLVELPPRPPYAGPAGEASLRDPSIRPIDP